MTNESSDSKEPVQSAPRERGAFQKTFSNAGTQNGFKKVVDKFVKTERALEAGFLGVGAAGTGVASLYVVLVLYFRGYETALELAVLRFAVSMFIGFIVGMMAGLLSGLILFFFSRMFDVGVTPRIAICVWGGLSGFLPWIPYGFYLSGNDYDLWIILFVSAGVLITMLCGQIGVVSFAWKYAGKKRGTAPPNRKQFQFSIRNLLVVTVLISVLLAVDRLSPSNNVIIMCLIYSVLQGMLILLDQLFVRLA